jgi:quinol-cytochrome oxidoreductase complex cytochrome b subunit
MKNTQNSILTFRINHIVTYSTFYNFNYFWRFGVFSFICLDKQLIFGVFLAKGYIITCFYECWDVMRDVNFGSLLRDMHPNKLSILCYLFIFI